MGEKMFRMEVMRQGVVLVHRETNDANGVIDACERWKARGYDVKLYRVTKCEIEWEGK